MPQSILLSLGLYSGFSILGIVTVLFLPIETKGRALQVRKLTFQDIFSQFYIFLHTFATARKRMKEVKVLFRRHLISLKG